MISNQSGIVIINKPTGVTSRFIVDIIGKAFATKKVGHTGTLDPLASGVMIVCVNKATKLVDYLTATDKEYLVTIKMGLMTDTLDITGEVVFEDSEFTYDKATLIETIKSFETTYEQEVPIYSAVKVNGRKCYEYARKNQPVALPKKTVTIHKISDISVENDIIKFKCLVSKGTYIRSLIRDIGIKVNIPMAMAGLERTKQGNFDISAASLIDTDYKLISFESLFLDYPKIEIDDNQKYLLENARVIENDFDTDYLRIYYQHKCVAIYQRFNKDKTKLKPLIIEINT